MIEYDIFFMIIKFKINNVLPPLIEKVEKINVKRKLT